MTINLQPKVAPHVIGVRDRLQAVLGALPTPILLGVGAPPRSATNRTEPLPYVALYVLPGGVDEGSLIHPQEIHRPLFQVSCFAMDAISTMHLIDVTREALSDRRNITVAGRKVMAMKRVLASPAVPLDDTTSDPAFQAFDRWLLETSPT